MLISQRLNDIDLPKKIFFIIFISAYLIILTYEFWYDPQNSLHYYLLRIVNFLILWLNWFLIFKKWRIPVES